MGGPRKYDAKAVEMEFVTGEVSIRELARRHGVSFSSLAKHARDNDWQGKKVAYKSSLARRGYEAMAAEVASQEGQIREENIMIMRATLRVYAERLKNGEVPISAKDAMDAVRVLATLLTEPEGVKDDRTIIEGSARTVDADFLRRVGEAARRRLNAPGAVAGTAFGESERTRPN
jgi:transposase-like protein